MTRRYRRPHDVTARWRAASATAQGLAAATLATGLAVALPLQAAAQTVAEHVAAARKLAGDDLTPLLGLCQAAPAERAPLDKVATDVAALIARPAPPPARVFDNLYYVGSAWVSAWALQTGDGLLLIDALNTADEAKQLIGGGLQKLGLGQEPIRHVVVTHAHGDHYGGANYLKTTYGTRIVMSEVDWAMSASQLEFAIPIWLPPPKRDTAGGDRGLNDGDTLVQGGTTVTGYLTPGHTLGTLTPVFEVRDGGRMHRAMVWGGTSFNFGRDLPRLDAYIAATEKMARVAEAQQIDVLLSNHPGFDSTVAKVASLAQRTTGMPHPFVLGTPAVVRALGVMGACAKAQRGRFTGG